MPAPGSVWAANSWHVDAWAADTWDDAVAPVVITPPFRAIWSVSARTPAMSVTSRAPTVSVTSRTPTISVEDA